MLPVYMLVLHNLTQYTLQPQDPTRQEPRVPPLETPNKSPQKPRTFVKKQQHFHIYPSSENLAIPQKIMLQEIS